jgi:hypothetical protein
MLFSDQAVMSRGGSPKTMKIAHSLCSPSIFEARLDFGEEGLEGRFDECCLARGVSTRRSAKRVRPSTPPMRAVLCP